MHIATAPPPEHDGIETRREEIWCERATMGSVNQQQSTGHEAAAPTNWDKQSMITLGWVTFLLAAVHLADHALRGDRVHDLNMPAAWDHSGWPFQPELTPYTLSLGGSDLNSGAGPLGHLQEPPLGWILARRRSRPWRYRHNRSLPSNGEARKSGGDLRFVGRQELVGAAAVKVTFAIVVALILMVANAIRVGLKTRRWL